jgi:hypothetical protein
MGAVSDDPPPSRRANPCPGDRVGSRVIIVNTIAGGQAQLAMTESPRPSVKPTAIPRPRRLEPPGIRLFKVRCLGKDNAYHCPGKLSDDSCNFCGIELTEKEKKQQARRIKFHRFLLWLYRHNLYTPTMMREDDYD